MAEKTVMVLVGTRPEAVKMAPVVMELRRRAGVRSVLLSTGQHREMLAQALKSFDLVPDADLDIMREGQDLAGLTARLIDGLDVAYRRFRPDVVLAQGDTTTVLAGALAAFYRKIPLAHVEAGLRTHDFAAPWPEEMNRTLADRLSRWCFAPTELAKRNLLAEGVPSDRIFVTGNTVIDALLFIRGRLNVGAQHAAPVLPFLPFSRESQKTTERTEGRAQHAAPLQEKRIILVTAHRRESFGAGFERICCAVRELADRFSDVVVVWPVHLNPNVREPVMRILGGQTFLSDREKGQAGSSSAEAASALSRRRMPVLQSGHDRILLVEPLGYEAFVAVMDRAHFCLTDSGGVQEEAPSLGKPVLVMRDATERPEGVDAGTSRLVGTDPDRILRESALLLEDPAEYARRSQIANPYGDGHAARRIVDILFPNS